MGFHHPPPSTIVRSANDPEVTIPVTNELLSELLAQQGVLADAQKQAEERERRMIRVASWTLVVAVLGVAATLGTALF